MENKRGILLIALGHVYYGRFVHNLAVSIKQVEPDMPIALVWAGAALDHLRVFHLADTFDYIIEAPKESYTKNGHTEYIKAKTWMYDFSPFDETIYIDADTVLTGFYKPSELFDQLKDVDFTAQSRGFQEIVLAKESYSMWASMREVREKFELPEAAKFYQVSSEFVYFRKTEKIKELFDQVKANYDDIRVQFREFGGGIPDELPLAIAMMQKGIYPHMEKFVPIYWQTIEKKIPQDLKQYFALSAGGRVNGEWTKKNYDRLVQHFFNSAGLRYVWKLQNKRSFLPEREKI